MLAEAGVVTSSDGGETWSPLPTSTLPGAVLDLRLDPINPRRLIANVRGAGLAAMTLPGGCSSGPTTLCLGPGGRFAVTADWQTGPAQGGSQGVGQAVNMTATTGAFWFFTAANL